MRENLGHNNVEYKRFSRKDCIWNLFHRRTLDRKTIANGYISDPFRVNFVSKVTKSLKKRIVSVQYQVIKTRDHCNQCSTLVTEVSQLWRNDEPVKVWCCLSIPPENSRKLKGFLMFSGHIDKQNRAVMG